MNCDCVANMNAKLREKYGLKLADKHFTLSWPECETRFIVHTQSTDSKKRKCVSVFASFCPFCGISAKKPHGTP